jgi:cell volume regulation protein A
VSAVTHGAVVVLVVAAATLLALASARLGAALRVPAPALFLVGAVAVATVAPSLRVDLPVAQRSVGVALALILFDGGMGIGVRRLRGVLAPVVWVGVAGTAVTAAGLAVAAHVLFHFGWTAALLLGTALSPTDPAVVFSVLGGRRVHGRSGTLLEGESGANDPVGIALMAALLVGGGWAAGLREFVLQMVIGAAIGAAGGAGLRWLMRAVALPGAGMYLLRPLAGALVVYGGATVAHGSGFLAVFVAGILIGDARAPYKREIEHFSGALSALAEIVAFVLLGLTVRLPDLAAPGVWATGLAVGALLAFVIRPLLVGLVLWPVRLRPNERAFVLWSGLKGAVPILLGTFIATSAVAGHDRLYGIVVVAVAFSVVVQGGLLPSVARRLRLPMTVDEPEPYAVGVRLREEPEDVHRHTVEAGSAGDGSSLAELPFDTHTWVAMVIRDGSLVPPRGRTRLRAGDEVVVLGDGAAVRAAFAGTPREVPTTEELDI